MHKSILRFFFFKFNHIFFFLNLIFQKFKIKKLKKQKNILTEI